MKCPACGIIIPEGVMGQPQHSVGIHPQTKEAIERVEIPLTFKCLICEWEDTFRLEAYITQEFLDCSSVRTPLEKATNMIGQLAHLLKGIKEQEATPERVETIKRLEAKKREWEQKRETLKKYGGDPE